MAAPGEMLTDPKEKIVFNGPFVDRYRMPLRITNDDTRQIGWAIKTNCSRRISTDPKCGILGPKENISLSVVREAFDFENTDVSADRITLVWLLTPNGAAKRFSQEWFNGDVILRQKRFKIEHNFGKDAFNVVPKKVEKQEVGVDRSKKEVTKSKEN